MRTFDIIKFINDEEQPLKGIPLRLTAAEENSTVSLPNKSGVIQYRTNLDQSWKTYTSTITLANIDDYAEFKGINNKVIPGRFQLTGKLKASGQVDSLLNWESLTENCFNSLFLHTDSLLAAPELPATTLAENCYANMFKECYSLSAAPELSATILAENCYANMFYGCTSLSTAPELPASALATRCYSHMFYGCSKLSATPELSATILAEYCYSNMFGECQNLAKGPEILPASTLYTGCYLQMFNGVSKIEKAPLLPAEALTYNCYGQMFCHDGIGINTQLNTISAALSSWNDGESTNNWVYHVAEYGIFYRLNENLPLEYGDSRIPTKWRVLDTNHNDLVTYNIPSTLFLFKEIPFTKQLSISGIAASQAISYSLSDFQNGITIINNNILSCYCTEEKESFTGKITIKINGNEHKTFDVSGTVKDISYLKNLETPASLIPVEDNCEITYTNDTTPIYYKINKVDSEDWSQTESNTLSQTLNTGDILQIKSNSNTANSKQFTKISKKTIVAGNIMSLINFNQDNPRNEEFKSLFSNTNVINAYNLLLPQMNLGVDYYTNMFNNCQELLKGPDLSATTLNQFCYQYMFGNCKNLTDMPIISGINLANYCCVYMFYNCTNLVNITELPASVLAANCYDSMFKGCSSLTTAPELPAANLVETCYLAMFANCNNLSATPILSSINLAPRCYSSMFANCINLKSGGLLPASTLKYGCYLNMFNGCTALNALSASFDTWTEYTQNWLQNVSPTGTFYALNKQFVEPTERNSTTIPSGWNIDTYKYNLYVLGLSGNIETESTDNKCLVSNPGLIDCSGIYTLVDTTVSGSNRKWTNGKYFIGYSVWPQQSMSDCWYISDSGQTYESLLDIENVFYVSLVVGGSSQSNPWDNTWECPSYFKGTEPAPTVTKY